MRESVVRFMTRRAAALAFAGMLALPLLLIAAPGSDPVAARVGPGLPAGTSSITGTARAIDGDTLEIAGVRVRLEGIDAPETDQTCGKGFFGTWKCGQEATDHVARLIRDRTVTCTSSGFDAYGRMLGVCVVAGLDINADLVRNGLAWAFVKYSQRYVALEQEARAARRGVFQGPSQPAWEWRAERWSAASTEMRNGAAPQCLIKGNVTRNGQIYHMPWDRWYTKTRIETEKGERWFCSETEAVAAGWRPATGR